MSLRRPGILDAVMGEKTVGEAAVEAGQRCALDESGTRESCEVDAFSPEVLAAGAGDVPCRGLLASCRCGRYLAGVRSGVRQGYETHCNGYHRWGQQVKRRATARLHRGDQTQTAGYLVPCVL